MSQRTAVPTIRFDATLYTIDKCTILRLPEKASGKLPSRGQVAVQGTINGHGFQTVLEPDGCLGHWMRIDGELQEAAAVSAGDTATLEIESRKDWPEPNMPQDLESALACPSEDPRPLGGHYAMARWEWVRWVTQPETLDTRKRRVEVRISKMKSGKRRPCCFNLAACTGLNLSKSGRLIEPAYLSCSTSIRNTSANIQNGSRAERPPTRHRGEIGETLGAAPYVSHSSERPSAP